MFLLGPPAVSAVGVARLRSKESFAVQPSVRITVLISGQGASSPVLGSDWNSPPEGCSGCVCGGWGEKLTQGVEGPLWELPRGPPRRLVWPWPWLADSGAGVILNVDVFHALSRSIG